MYDLCGHASSLSVYTQCFMIVLSATALMFCAALTTLPVSCCTAVVCTWSACGVHLVWDVDWNGCITQPKDDGRIHQGFQTRMVYLDNISFSARMVYFKYDIYYSRDTSFWSGTLDTILVGHL